MFFAADLILWHNSIDDVGAGLATVLANIQVVLVPLVAWAVLAERPGRRVLAALPHAQPVWLGAVWGMISAGSEIPSNSGRCDLPGARATSWSRHWVIISSALAPPMSDRRVLGYCIRRTLLGGPA